MPRAGLIVNDGKDLAVKTAKTFQKKLEGSGFEVVRVSSAGGLLGFTNPDQYMSSQGYNSCCLLYTSPSPRDGLLSRMPSSA